MRGSVLVPALIVGFVAPALAGPFEDGLTAYGKGDYATTLEYWRPLAEQGLADAQSSVGWMYAKGEGVPRDDAEAVKWYRRAAEQGHAEAQYNLGSMYDEGLGVSRSPSRSGSSPMADKISRMARSIRGVSTCVVWSISFSISTRCEY